MENKYKKIKFKLKKIFLKAAIITTIYVTTTQLVQKDNKEPKIAYTEEDMVNNLQFNQELTEILKEESINFKNEELYEIIAKEVEEPITKEKLQELTELKIYNKLTNQDFSDLKYLPNLNSLYIFSNTINLEDIKYNQDLYVLYLNECNFSSVKSIPNSTRNIHISNSICLDKYFIVPYYTKEITLIETPINNIFFKNAPCVETLSITGDSFIDINNLKECTNLKNLEIKRCANIKSSEILKEITSLESIILDDYAPIWINLDTLENIPIDKETKIILSEEVKQLDDIASKIIPYPELTSYIDKIRNISLYILKRLDYNDEIPNNIEEIKEYNENPIYNVLNNDDVICINYACLFQALGNRTGIDIYQLFSNTHSWNIIKFADQYRGFDLTYLDEGSIVELKKGGLIVISDKTPIQLITENKENILYYYNFIPEEINDIDHQATMQPTDIINLKLNIDYINENSLVKKIEKNEKKLSLINEFIKNFLVITILTLGLNIHNENKKEKRLLKEPKNNR